jgi:23S rRNA (cytosine1962-C5)-methyltransferase
MLDPDLLAKYNHQAEMLANKAKKRFRHLHKRFVRQNIEVFRLYDWDIPEIRAVVDWYAGHLVVGEYIRSQSTPEWLPMMGAAVAAALDVPPENLHLKERVYGTADGQRYPRLDTTHRTFVVSERDLKFHVNPWDFVDTGLFGDHRDTRQMVRAAAAGKDFLNLFCYTGTFSCYAAKGGARRTLSVDRSKGNIAWARRNLELNAIDPTRHRLVQMHVFDFLAAAKTQAERFDLAVLDPPSFYTIKEQEEHFDINTHHPMLLASVALLMHPGAVIFFSTNHQDFKPCMDALGFSDVQEITAATIPEDYRHKRKRIHRCWKIVV